MTEPLYPCRKCHTPKPASLMHKDSTRKSGLSQVCAACRSQLNADYYARYRESVRLQRERRRAAGR